MKIKSLLAALVVVGTLIAACSAQTSTVELTGVGVVDSSCALQSNVFQERGYFDVGVSNQFLLPVTFQNSAQPITTSVNGETISTASKNFFGQQLVVSYTSNPSASWATETEESSFTMQAGDSKGSFLLADLIQPKALAQLQTMAPALGSGTPMTLNATIKVKGQFADGTSGETNELTFPLSVVKGPALTCAAGQVLVGSNDTCGNVQGVPSCADAGT
jgi:hypothetical protein